MSWQKLARFRDRTVPKLYNLARAEAAGLRVPATWWARAAEAEGHVRDLERGPAPVGRGARA
jgi:hypothetical protein